MNICLVFDVFITDKPLFPNKKLQELTKSTQKEWISSYVHRNRMDITLYTLTSYASLNFDHVLIFYELDQEYENFDFEGKVLQLFPRAQIFSKRSSTGSDFRTVKQALSGIDVDLVFYSPNNDHPFISDKSIYSSYIEKLLKIDADFKSLVYSHCHEINYASQLGYWSQRENFPNLRILAETSTDKTIFIENGYSVGMQIASRNLFLRWCEEAIKLGDTPLKRLDDLAAHISLPAQTTLVPKTELCRHYDAYYHTVLHWPNLKYNNLPAAVVPPLFIPKGFFCGKIKLKIGFSEYDPTAINVSSSASRYSFEVDDDFTDCTDIKGSLADVPGFWMSRVEKIEFAETADAHSKIDNNSLVEGFRHLDKLSFFENEIIVLCHLVQRLCLKSFKMIKNLSFRRKSR